MCLENRCLAWGATEHDADCLYAYGEKVGLAFQLQDDYLDVYGDFDTFGKAIGGDILCNKKTFMLINAYNRAPEALRNELERWLTALSYDTDEKIKAVTRIYTQVGVDKMAQERISSYIKEAGEILDRVNLPDERKSVLRQWTEQLMNRKR